MLGRMRDARADAGAGVDAVLRRKKTLGRMRMLGRMQVLGRMKTRVRVTQL